METVSGLFSIPISVFAYPGIHYPDIKWNGWAVPYFTLDTCRRIIEDTEGPSFEDEMDGVNTLVQDGITYYSLGAFSWCWTPVGPDLYHRFVDTVNTLNSMMLQATGRTHLAKKYAEWGITGEETPYQLAQFVEQYKSEQQP